MKDTLKVIFVTLALTFSYNANATEKEVIGGGGFNNLSTFSQIVAVAVVGLVADAIATSNPYTCQIKKVPPLPGTNYTNEKSVCTKG